MSDADDLRQYRAALERLASTEAFEGALDLDHATPEALAAELRARGRFAEDVLVAKILPAAEVGA